ncbi:MAG TPA: hypothetical protein ENN19_12550 [Chloroflexi bacterium]|nr:hypothetical protein [Chloroflexota bacterium]
MSATLDGVLGYRSGRRCVTSRRKKGAEAIELQKRRHGYFPQVFVWRGDRYDVQAVERCWTIKRRGWRGEVAQHRFRVRCAYGPPDKRCVEVFEIYQDVHYNTWHIVGAL